MAKVYIQATLSLIVDTDEDIQDVMDSLNIVSDNEDADILDFQVEEYEISDAK